jgi:3-deoxy-D-manno-octulosonic-acid transferase
MGCKIYHGPYISNFDDIYMFLKDKNLSQEISTIHNLSDNLIIDLKTKKNLDQSKDLFDKIGETILEKTFKEIDNFLNYENL